MANCFRCGKKLTQQKCTNCGFDPQSGVRLLTKWTGKYDIPKVEPRPVAPPPTPASTPPPAPTLTPTPTVSSTATPMPQAQPKPAGTNWRAKNRSEDLKKWLVIIGLGLAALAGLAALVFGVVKLVSWMGTFSGYTWRMIGAAVVAAAIPTITIIAVENMRFGIDQVSEYIVVPILSVINLLLMIIFPEIYRPMGAVIAIGLGVSFAYLAYKLLDNLEPAQGAVCAVFMIANLLLFPHLWGVSWLGWILYVVLVLICVGLAAVYVSNDWENPVVLQSGFVGIAVIIYLVGFLTMPHFMHAMNRLPEFSDDRSVGQETIEAECFCGETLEVNPFTEDLIHGTHCVFKFVFLPECEGDETGHWQICTCGETYNYQEHVWNDEGLCGYCKYPQDGAEIGGETGETTETEEETENTTEDETDGTTEEETSKEDESAEKVPTEEGGGEDGTTEERPNHLADFIAKIKIRTVFIIGAVIAALVVAGAVVYYLVTENTRYGRRLTVSGTDRLIGGTTTGVYGVIVLTAAACAFLKLELFGLSLAQPIIGLVAALILGAVLISTELVTDEYSGQIIAGIILSVLNLAAMLIFPDTYRPIGALVAGGLAVSFAQLTFAGFDDLEPGWGGTAAFFMAIDLLLVFTLFGISLLGWIVLVGVALIWLIVVIIYSNNAEMASGLQIGFGVFFLVASLCGYLFAPHFMHSLHRAHDLKEQSCASETIVGAECVCGEMVGMSVSKVDWIHSFHCLMKGSSAQTGHSAGEHWKICVCGATYTYKEHEYDENGECIGCGHINGEGVDEGKFMLIYDENEDWYVVTEYQGESAHFRIPGLYNGKPVVIGEHAFEDNQLLREVVVSEGVKAIGTYAFEGCAALETVHIGSVEKIGEGAFLGCTSLRTFEFSPLLTTIETGSFSRCGFTHVELPYGVTTIGMYAFASCQELESIGIPSSVKQINVGAFNQCPKLSTVYFHGSRDQWEALNWTEKSEYEAMVYFME